jgi:hypothetical protein
LGRRLIVVNRFQRSEQRWGVRLTFAAAQPETRAGVVTGGATFADPAGHVSAAPPVDRVIAPLPRRPLRCQSQDLLDGLGQDRLAVGLGDVAIRAERYSHLDVSRVALDRKHNDGQQ